MQLYVSVSGWLMAYCGHLLKPICYSKTVGVLQGLRSALHMLLDDNSVSGCVALLLVDWYQCYRGTCFFL